MNSRLLESGEKIYKYEIYTKYKVIKINKTTLDMFVRDAEKQGFKVERGKSGHLFFEDDARQAADFCFATLGYKERGLYFSAVSSLPDRRANLTRIAKKYGISVRSATALTTSEPEFGPGTFEYN